MKPVTLDKHNILIYCTLLVEYFCSHYSASNSIAGNAITKPSLTNQPFEKHYLLGEGWVYYCATLEFLALAKHNIFVLICVLSAVFENIEELKCFSCHCCLLFDLSNPKFNFH